MLEDLTYIHDLLAALKRAERSTVLRYDGMSVTGGALRSLIFRYARVLYSLGITHGKLLALVAPNCPDAIAIRYGAHVLGAATTYLPMPSLGKHRKALLERTAPDLLVVFPESERFASSEARFATVGFDCTGSQGRLDRLAELQSDTRLDVMARPDELAVIVSSGGTTGISKGSCRSFAGYTAMVGAPSAPDRRQLVNGHLAYLSQVLVDITLLGRGCVVLRNSFEPVGTLATVEAERITDLFLVEPQLFELMDHPQVKAYDLSSLRSLIHIGASAPQCLRLRARERLGPVVGHVYGASEMGVVSVLAPKDHDPSHPNLFTSAGRILPGVEVRFRGADGRLIENGGVGVVEVRSAAIASGYRNNSDLTALNFKDGWYKTGDLGRLDSEGFLHILGRAVDTQEKGGLLVTLTGIENALCQLPAVRYASVIRENGTRLVAAVCPWPGSAVDAQECRRAVERRFSKAVAASLAIVPVDRVPTTEQGKPDRVAIEMLAPRRVAA